MQQMDLDRVDFSCPTAASQRRTETLELHPELSKCFVIILADPEDARLLHILKQLKK